MLDALRKGTGTWVAQLFIALLVLSFAVWGVSDIFTGFRGDTVATVGDGRVSSQKFYREYELAKRRLSQQIGQPITDQQAQLFGIPGQVLGRLVSDATLDDRASTFAMGVSGDMMARQIADDPTFQGPDGNFDRGRFVQVINAVGMTEDDFVEDLRGSYVRQQLATALAGGVTVPDAYLRAFDEFAKEERDIAYVNLTTDLVGEVPDPSEAELSAFFEDRKAEWRAPELRAVRIMAMNPADLADVTAISDGAAQEIYDNQLESRFTTAERRRVQQIVFADMSEATAAAADLANGKTFEDLMADRNLTVDDVDLGLTTRDKIVDPAVADAAFALAPDAVSEVIDGRFGPVIVKVTEIEPAVVTPFEDAKAEIKQELAEARAEQEISDLLDVIEDARAGGATLDEVAADYGLTIVDFKGIDQGGRDIDGAAVPDLPGGRELVQAVYESDVGLENNPLPAGRGFVWFEVTAVNAPRDRELSEVRDAVVTAFKQAEVDRQLLERAEAIRGKLAGGETLAEVAGAEGLTAETATAITRRSQPTPSLSAAAIQSAFHGPDGHMAVANGPDDAKTVVVVTSVTVPAYFSGTPEGEQTAEQLRNALANEYLQQYVGQLQTELGVLVNQTALQQLISGAPQGGAHQGM